MPLLEFYCDGCKYRFEQITSSTDPDRGKCPKCNANKNTRKLISRFAVGGQGDLRESTMHGCHDAHVSPGPAEPAGHVHGAGCGHGGGGGTGHNHD